MENDLGAVVGYAIDMVLRAPHLYALTVVYWVLIAGVLLTRYGLRRRVASVLFMRAVVVLGCVAVVLAFVDAAVRGQELVQLSLVAYFATPIGIGRFLIRKWDHIPTGVWAGLALREISYVCAFLAFVGLSIVDGDPWWFTPPEIDRSSAMATIENTNWLHFMATIFGVTAVVEALSAPFRKPASRRVANGRGSAPDRSSSQ